MIITALPVSGSPIPINVASVWGSFLYEGLLAPTLTDQRLDQVLNAWGCGCIELVMASCQHLPELWRQIALRWKKEDTDFPGVFEYEVVSSLGIFLGDYLLKHDGTLPDQQLVQMKIHELIETFFASSTDLHPV